MWLLFVALLSGGALCSDLDSYDYDNNLEATNDQLTSNVYILPKQIFNDGKPFYVKKDPVSGTLNFNAKTTPAEPIADDDDAASLPSPATTLTTHDDKRNGTSADAKHDISVKTSSTQNIHDYLNLPVKYSSSKFVYPLVSSSYANLKYQGNNKNYISNHKYDSSTLKSVPAATANNYKKYKTPYPTKAHYHGSSSSATVPKKVSSSSTTTAATKTTAMTNTFESTTKSPQASDTPPALRPSYTTIGHRDRANNTIIRNATPTAMRPIVVPSENRLERENATHSSRPIASAEKEPSGGDSMNFGDLFNYFFDNSEDNEATEPHEEPAKKATTPVPTTTTQRPFDRRTTVEAARVASTTTTNTAASTPSSTPTPTRPASTPTSTRLPSTHTPQPEHRPSYAASTPGARNPSPDQFPDHLFNGHGSNFHPPSSSEVSNIVVAPGSHTASFVATGQLSAGGSNFERRPVADASYRPATPNNIVTGSFATKGHVADAYAPSQQPAHFHVPASNMNNIVVAPGSQTASFVASGHLAMGAPAPDSDNGESQVNEQRITETVNAINVYDTIKLSTQRPQGFAVQATTTTRPAPSAHTPPASNDSHRVRFPAAHANAPPPMLTLQQQQQQQQQQMLQNHSIKFPSTQNSAAEPLPGVGLVKLDNRNEILDRNQYKQIVKQPFNVNRVVFERERPLSQPNLVDPASMQAPPFNPNLHAPPPPPSFNFKKPPFIQYPRKNLTLPNILPQFRPNTQLPTMDGMNQLRPGHFNRPLMYGGQNVRYKPPMPYHYAGIRTKAPLLVVPPGGHPLVMDQSHNRRHFELHQANANQFNNRIFDRTLTQHLLHRTIERNPPAAVAEDQQYSETAKVAEISVVTKPAAAVESDEVPKIEPVTTLQQIQQQRLLHKQQQQQQQPSIVDAVNAASESSENSVATKSSNSQLYVVYPVPDAATAAAAATSSHKATTAVSPQTNHFPYALEKSHRYILNSRPPSELDEKPQRDYERPDIAAEHDDSDSTDDGEHPIAIAYTPTESNRPQAYETPYSERNTHESTHRLDVDASVAALNEQSFMAPFFPSVNLENTQSTHNGWSVVTPSSAVLESRHDSLAAGSEAKSNKISTSLTVQSSDEVVSSETTTNSPVETTTRKFDINNFQPELQGGFRPIYKTSEMPTLKPDKSDSVYDEEEI